jgi:hypothetical protein
MMGLSSWFGWGTERKCRDALYLLKLVAERGDEPQNTLLLVKVLYPGTRLSPDKYTQNTLLPVKVWYYGARLSPD